MSAPRLLWFRLAARCVATVALLLAPGCDRAGSPSSGEAVAGGSGNGLAAPPSGNSQETASGEGATRITDPRPDAPTLLFTTGVRGYTEPCGCTADLLLGGIDRVSGFVLAARALAPHSLVLDGGNLLFDAPFLEPARRAQELPKAELLAAALARMGTLATVPGPLDLAAGLDFYIETLASHGIQILSSNLTTAGGTPIGLPWMTQELGSLHVGIVGAVDPELFAGMPDVAAAPLQPALDEAVSSARAAGATVVVLLFQGDVASARTHLAAVAGIDFILVGSDPRETDEVETVGSAFTIEPFDQGRYVGRLKLVASAGTPPSDDRWRNAREGSPSEIARLDRIIAGLEDQLASLTTSGSGEEPPIVARQRERLREMHAERERMSHDDPIFPADARSFLWESFPMEPGLPLDPETSRAVAEFNRALRELNSGPGDLVIQAPPGAPTYAGQQTCVGCHPEEASQWDTTRHAHAVATLVSRNKDFDRNCIGCHVTGYQLPGGSAFNNYGPLQNVQCEQCHGPGSLHNANPLLPEADGGLRAEVSATDCVGCHSAEHSPRFEFDEYVPRILGPGHSPAP